MSRLEKESVEAHDLHEKVQKVVRTLGDIHLEKVNVVEKIRTARGEHVEKLLRVLHRTLKKEERYVRMLRHRFSNQMELVGEVRKTIRGLKSKEHWLTLLEVYYAELANVGEELSSCLEQVERRIEREFAFVVKSEGGRKLFFRTGDFNPDEYRGFLNEFAKEIAQDARASKVGGRMRALQKQYQEIQRELKRAWKFSNFGNALLSTLSVLSFVLLQSALLAHFYFSLGAGGVSKAVHRSLLAKELGLKF